MPDHWVLCDASPLVYLHRIAGVDLLQKLYTTVTVPVAVAEELRLGLELGHDCPRLDSLPWLRILPLPKAVPLITLPDLGSGEAELLTLARLHPGCLVIMDEMLGRQVAKLNGLKVTGTAGVMLRAKEQRLIASVAACLNQLLAAGFWLDDDTRRVVLKAAGE